MASHPQVIVVGAGLSGLAAAHTLFEKGANVLVLEKVSREAFNGQLRSIRRVHGSNHSPLPLHAAQNPFGGGAWIARRAMRVFSLLFVRRRKPDSRLPLGLPLPPPQATRPVRAQVDRSLCSCSPSIDFPPSARRGHFGHQRCWHKGLLPKRARLFRSAARLNRLRPDSCRLSKRSVSKTLSRPSLLTPRNRQVVRLRFASGA